MLVSVGSEIVPDLDFVWFESSCLVFTNARSTNLGLWRDQRTWCRYPVQHMYFER